MVKSYLISAHPYLFEQTFPSTRSSDKRWTGNGHVILHAEGGGVNQAWALVEADEEGHAALEKAGFMVDVATKGRYVDSCGKSYEVLDAGGAVNTDSAT